MIGRFRGFLEVLYFGLKILEMLLFTFTEGSLSSTVLSFAFLILLVYGMIYCACVYMVLTEVGSDVNGFRPGFFEPLSSPSRLFPPPSSLLSSSSG